MSNKKLSQLPDNAAPAADGTSVAAVTATTTGGTTTYTNQIVTVRNLVKAGVQAGGVGLATVATTGSYTNLTNVPATFPPSSHNHDDRYYTEAETDVLLAGKQATGNYATLDGSGRVPAAQLPSYVDDVEEYANFAALPNPGQQGKIYVTLDTNKIYRWSATTYLEISPSPGSTDSVAEGAVNLYYTNARASAAAPVQSVAGRTGAVTLTNTDIAGLGTIATQNANSVAITGGSINGTTIGATTASTGVFTAVTVIGAGDAGFGAVTTGGNIAHVTLQNQATGGRSYSMRAWGSAGSGAFGIDDLTANARRFTIDSTGNVGVGTASPAARLDVAGADSAVRVGTGSYGRVQMSGGNADGFLYGSFAALGDGVHLGYNYYANAAGTGVVSNAGGPTSRVTVGYGFVAFATSSAINTAPTERVRIDGSGNVGIGTASPAQRLHLYHFTADCVATVQGRTTSLGGSGRAAVQIDVDGHGGFAIQTDATSGTKLLRVISNGGYGSGSVDCMAVTSGGNVGIGTASPGTKLHVAGSGQGIFIEDTGANRAVLGLYAFNNELRIQGTAYVNASQPMTFWTANTERMRIDANGNVGIGTAPHPSAKLHVQGGQIFHSTTDFVVGSTGTVIGTGHGAATGNTYGFIAATNVGGAAWSNLVLQSGGGNVGIGTTNPGSRLEVIPGGGQGINCLNNGGAGTVNYAVMAQAAGVAGANTGLYVNCFNASSNYGIRIINPPAGANNWAIYSDATAQSYFAGNVGIGTTSPSSRLHVTGGTITTDDGAINPRSIGPETIIEFTGNRTLALSDASRLLVYTGTTAVSVTIPADATVNFPIGTRIRVMHSNVNGDLTFLPFQSSTPTIRAAAPNFGPYVKYAIERRPGEAMLTKIAANLWVLTGSAIQS